MELSVNPLNPSVLFMWSRKLSQGGGSVPVGCVRFVVIFAIDVGVAVGVGGDSNVGTVPGGGAENMTLFSAAIPPMKNMMMAMAIIGFINLS